MTDRTAVAPTSPSVAATPGRRTAAGSDISEAVGHLRGSSLLLAGRGLSLGVTFLAQVIIVRYLPKAEYGAFAYALSIATLLAGLTTAGLDRAVPRFLPIFQEHRDDSRFVGTILLAVATVLGLGLTAILAVVALQGVLTGSGFADRQSVALLAILIVLAPLQAFDDLQAGLLAVVSTPGAIFVRRYVLAPGLRLLVVVLLAASGGDARFLAAGYVAASAVAVVAYAVVLWRILGRSGVIGRARQTGIELPARDLFGFALPLLSTDLLYLVLGASDVVILGYVRGASEVADLRAIQPLAVLNLVVLSSFTLLYTPLAARLFARRDADGSNDAYWRSAIWIALLSFPIFIVTTTLAVPLATLLFGSRYAGSGTLLAILATGYYVNSALGFNGLTLKIHGHIRAAVLIDVTAAVVNVVANLALIPPLGALGAAIGTGLTLVLHNVLKQVALHRKTGIALFDASVVRVYVAIVAATVVVWGATALLALPTIAAALAVGGAIAVVIGISREQLMLSEVFPELRSLPLLGRLFG